MITINFYTGAWQKAINPAPPKTGTVIRIHDNPDAREWNDFISCLRSHGLRLSSEPTKRWPRLRLDSYKVEKIGKNIDNNW